MGTKVKRKLDELHVRYCYVGHDLAGRHSYYSVKLPYGGKSKIRTYGPYEQRFSRPPQSSTLPFSHLAGRVGFEPTEDALHALSRFQGECNKPGSAIYPI